MKRVLTPELLDHLPPEDPQALRSRADLIWVNRLMGTGRWVRQKLAQWPDGLREVVELGAGDGHLLEQLHRIGVSLRDAHSILTVEPHRRVDALALSKLLLPFVGPVTRHDMTASIRAGCCGTGGSAAGFTDHGAGYLPFYSGCGTGPEF